MLVVVTGRPPVTQQPTDLSRGRPLIFYGLVLCLTYSVISWLSLQFIYGHGHQQRPILSFLGCYGVAFLLYWLAWREVRRLHHADFSLTRIVLSFALCFRAIVLWSQPIQEDDFYRYLWDGKVVASGLNSYAVSPQSVKDAGQNDSELQAYARIPQQEPDFARILARVNHPAVPTIYPPLAQGVFGLLAIVAPGSLFALRVSWLCFDAALCWFIISVLRNLEINPAYVILYAWSPLVIKESVNSAHYDVMPTCWLVLALLLSLRGKGVLAHGSLALAVLGKVYPLLLLPVLTLRTSRTQGCRHAVLGLLLLFTLIGCGYAAFWQEGVLLGQGTRTFAEQWQTNSLLFPLIRKLMPDRWTANVLVMLILGGVLMSTLIRFDVRDSRQFLWSVFVVLGVAFLLSPVGNPWYFLWLVPFLCVFPLRSWLLLSGLLGLYYVSFFLAYHHQRETFRWVIWLEYVPFYTMLVWERTLGSSTECGVWNRRREE